jgi:hypothetical protein
MGEERQAYVVQVTKPDPAMRGGLEGVPAPQGSYLRVFL